MDVECWITPILPGQEDAARSFADEMNGPRRAALGEAEHRLGVSKEAIFFARLPSGPALVFYMESEDMGEALQASAASEDGFDRWYTATFHQITGLVIGEPIEPLEPLMVYSKQEDG